MHGHMNVKLLKLTDNLKQFRLQIWISAIILTWPHLIQMFQTNHRSLNVG